jgi:polyhydroxyalkanoate synthesis regulator protein
MKTLQLKKYSNRKLYSKELGTVNSSMLLEQIKSGHDIKVSCHKTGADLTNKVLLTMLKNTNFAELDLVLSLLKRD